MGGCWGIVLWGEFGKFGQAGRIETSYSEYGVNLQETDDNNSGNQNDVIYMSIGKLYIFKRDTDVPENFFEDVTFSLETTSGVADGRASEDNSPPEKIRASLQMA